MQPWLRGALKARLLRFLTERGNLVANQPTQDSYGGLTPTSVSVEANVPVRIIRPGDETTGAAAVIGGAEVLRNMHRIVARQGTGLAADQQWVVNNVTWQIVRVVTDLTDDLYEMAVVERVR